MLKKIVGVIGIENKLFLIFGWIIKVYDRKKGIFSLKGSFK